MNKYFGLCLSIGIGLCYADNIDIFNNAMSAGSQHKFSLNLNQNSTIDSYGQAESFLPGVAQGANAGNAVAKDIYNGQTNDPNYLYNSGTKAIKDCETESDPRCSTLNKYGDKDTQRQIQAYSQGFSTKYLISVSPDPVDSSCSIVKRKSPINPSDRVCTAGSKEQTQCHNVMTPSASQYTCDDSKGECEWLKNNCTLIRPFVPGQCILLSTIILRGNFLGFCIRLPHQR